MSDTELRRRLGDLAGLATVEDDAWDRLQERIAADPSRSPARGRGRARWQLGLVAAAAAALIVGAVLARRSDDDGGVRTIDEDTTTTLTEDTSTSSSTTTTTTSATTLPEGVGTADPPGETPGDEGDGSGATPEPGTTPDPGPGASPTPTTAAPAAPPPTVPGGDRVWVSVAASGYTLQGTFVESQPGRFRMSLWRQGGDHLADLLLSNRPGQNCLAGGDPVDLAQPEPGADLYTWGLVRADAARVRVVLGDGSSTNATLGASPYSGIRVWIARVASDQVDRFEALTSTGQVLHTAQWTTNLDAFPDRC